MAQLILIIWKFLRNYILKQLQQKRLRTEKNHQSLQLRSQAKKARKNEPLPTQENEGTLISSSFIWIRFSCHVLSLLEVSSDSENENESSDDHEDFNEGTLTGLIDIICIILNGNKTKLKTPQNLVYWENIKKRFNKSCSLFFRYFRVNKPQID